MITTKKELKLVLKYEKTKYHVPRLWRIMAILNLNEVAIIWKYQRRLRKWEYHQNAKHKIRRLMYKFSTNSLGRKCGFSFAPNCVEKGLLIKHIGPILVNSKAHIGENCTLHINTAFVSTGGNNSSPSIGNNCKIGVGATLVGNIVLKDDIVVGAGAVVTKSFEESHITLGGVPAKIISHKAVL